jgi:hypothetical protein
MKGIVGGKLRLKGVDSKYAPAPVLESSCTQVCRPVPAAM